MSLKQGQVIKNRYEVQRKLGVGGMGVVYLCADLTLGGREVALKTIKLLEQGVRRERLIERFLSEIAITASVRHDNVVNITDRGMFCLKGSEEQTPFMVMEYLEGRSLDELLADKPLDPLRCVRLFEGVLDALKKFHEMDSPLVHKDLKPSNLFLVHPGRPSESLKILDFGVACFLDNTRHTEGEGGVGTWRYMAPEYQEDMTRATPAVDVYQAGLTMIEALTGEFPVTGHVRSRDNLKVDERFKIPGLWAVLEKATRYDPERRYRDAGSMLDALKVARGILERSSLSSLPAVPVMRLIAALAGVVCFGVGAFVLLTEPNKEEAPCPKFHERDGENRCVAQMVQISVGFFRRGSTPTQINAALAMCNAAIGEGCERSRFEDEHRVPEELGAFEIDVVEVTNDAFRACVDAKECEPPEDYCGGDWTKEGHGQHPVTCVNHKQAEAYCGWVGKQLPTEAQWERAARGKYDRIFPWGDEVPGSNSTTYGNFDVKGHDDGYEGTAPVGSFPAGKSPAGVMDMSGNVWEWTSSIHENGVLHVVRGGGCVNVNPSYLRAAYRHGFYHIYAAESVGFRCVRLD